MALTRFNEPVIIQAKVVNFAEIEVADIFEEEDLNDESNIGW